MGIFARQSLIGTGSVEFEQPRWQSRQQHTLLEQLAHWLDYGDEDRCFFCLFFPAIKRTQFDRMWEREKERGKGKEQQQQLVSFRENQPRTRGNIMAAATEYNNADRAVQSTLNKNFN